MFQLFFCFYLVLFCSGKRSRRKIECERSYWVPLGDYVWRHKFAQAVPAEIARKYKRPSWKIQTETPVGFWNFPYGNLKRTHVGNFPCVYWLLFTCGFFEKSMWVFRNIHVGFSKNPSGFYEKTTWVLNSIWVKDWLHMGSPTWVSVHKVPNKPLGHERSMLKGCTGQGGSESVVRFCPAIAVFEIAEKSTRILMKLKWPY